MVQFLASTLLPSAALAALQTPLQRMFDASRVHAKANGDQTDQKMNGHFIGPRDGRRSHARRASEWRREVSA